ncbi:type II secretion system protein [Candidatus Daviesbacteria bacterium]|nr:type II secretion system protein [Candidatus Daviesbacteria bacterium]
MRKFLPRTVNNPKGFTLVELLVAISILAILSMIGVVGFTSVQKNARDAKRKADMDAMAAAMEANYITGTGYPTSVAGSWFAGSALPANPGPGGAAYNTNTPTTTGYVFCALLENKNGNSASSTSFSSISGGDYYCRVNSQ